MIRKIESTYYYKEQKDKKPEPAKLVSKRKMFLMLIAAYTGIGLHAYMSYSSAGKLEPAVILIEIIGIFVSTGIILAVTWWANK